MKKLLWLCLCMGAGALYAQTIPVDHYTGRPVINIPLVEINDRNLFHSVSAYYDASGVKVNSVSGMIGANWTLAAGGMVKRELRGLPDEINLTNRKGWLYSGKADDIAAYSYPAEGAASNCTTDDNAFDFLETLRLVNDTEPDIFHFNAGGISGSFLFDNTGSASSIRFLQHQDLKVELTQSSTDILSIKIITAEGVKYTFGLAEAIGRVATKGVTETSPFHFKAEYDQYASQIQYNDIWRLTKIESATGETISFQYELNEFAYRESAHEVKTAIGGYPDIDSTIVNQYKISENRMYSHYLSRINSSHQQIEFKVEESQLTDNNLLIRSIVVNELSTIGLTFVKEIIFGYTHGGKLYLRSVRTRDNCEVHQPISFEYYTPSPSNGIDIDLPGSNNQDIWGYQLDAVFDHKIPKLYIYASLSGIHKVSLFEKPGVTPTAILPGVERTGGATPVVGTLSRIIYPTGGWHELKYESHSFYNPITNAAWTGGGLRIKEIITQDGLDAKNVVLHSYEYKKSDGSTSGKLLTLPAFHRFAAAYRDTSGQVTSYSTLSSLPAAEQWDKLTVRTEDNINNDFFAIPTIVYERVTEKISTGHGKTVYEFDVPYVYGAAADSVWSSSYVHLGRNMVSSNCPSPALITPGFHESLFPPQTPTLERGLPVKISWYAEGQNDPVREVINTYNDKFVSAGTVTAIRYDLIKLSNHPANQFYLYAPYKIRTNRKKVLVSTTERTRTHQAPYTYQEVTTLYNYAGAHGFLTSTSTTGSSGKQYVSKMKYAADFGAPQATNGSTPLQVKLIDQLNTQHRGGTLVEEVQSIIPSGGSETTYTGTLIMFQDVNPGDSARIVPKEVYTLRTNGISSFNLSSFSGSGVSRTFSSNAAYTKRTTLAFTNTGDLIRTESDKREVVSFHPDWGTGLSIASILSAEASEVIYSNFDQQTPYSFSKNGLGNFVLNEGRTGGHALGGWRSADTANYLKKTLVKKPSSNYILSLWYKPVDNTLTHAFTVKVKTTGGTLLTQETITFTIDGNSTAGWYYGEKVVNLSAISNTTVNIEVRFSGTWSHKTTSGMVDDVMFAPEGVDILRTTYNTAYGVIGSIAADGQMTEYELTRAGKPKFIRDHNRDIRQKSEFTQFKKSESELPISIITDDYVFDNTLTQFTASIACLDVETLQWKVSPASNPSSGSYFNGAEIEPYTFTTPGSYIVWLKITHPSYGTFECSTPVQVVLAPLAVSICPSQGATVIDICTPHPYYVMETHNCPGSSYEMVDMHQTTFQADVSGCGGGETYTYSWSLSSTPDFSTGATALGSGSSVLVYNLQHHGTYYIRCYVSSSCGRTGMSNTFPVLIYRSNEACQGPMAD